MGTLRSLLEVYCVYYGTVRSRSAVHVKKALECQMRHQEHPNVEVNETRIKKHQLTWGLAEKGLKHVLLRVC